MPTECQSQLFIYFGKTEIEEKFKRIFDQNFSSISGKSKYQKLHLQYRQDAQLSP